MKRTPEYDCILSACSVYISTSTSFRGLYPFQLLNQFLPVCTEMCWQSIYVYKQSDSSVLPVENSLKGAVASLLPMHNSLTLQGILLCTYAARRLFSESQTLTVLLLHLK